MRFSIFYPKSRRAIYNDFPELRKHQELTSIPPKDLVFVWYYACKASPLYDVEDDVERVKQSMDRAYTKEEKKRKYDDLVKLNFGEKMRKAINVMATFDPGARLQALEMTRQAFNNIKSLISVQEEDLESQFLDKDGNVDWSKKKAYIDSVKNAHQALPQMVKDIENAFGVVESEEDDEDFTNHIEDWVERNY